VMRRSGASGHSRHDAVPCGSRLMDAPASLNLRHARAQHFIHGLSDIGIRRSEIRPRPQRAVPSERA
jgi:hypothetical protein